MTLPARDPGEVVAALRPLLPRHDSRQIGSATEQIWHQQRTSVKAVEGADFLLHYLKQSGFKLGVLSNTWHPLFSGFVENCGALVGVIDHALLSYRLGRKKPCSSLFHLAVEASGTTADRCWMIGDSFEQDIEPARRLGMKTAWVLKRPQLEIDVLVGLLRGQLRGPDLVVRDLAQLQGFLVQEDIRP
jgi:HAD superfamily hydrolase (TIGR01509 family)